LIINRSGAALRRGFFGVGAGDGGGIEG